ncbi:MAG: hypothetical protein COS47_00625 [Candidatus Nealsonbacteria bacterium CG03_land_8_20_14_0_80_36_12]|uniref:Uncharacterized protein n=1 Tax=Candidatus Nealsonbacteria bacterium CG03_land_8_20_14_0_80_36_12 TaxID=1974701 RepID=A0A2M7BYP4_9BACT|nr:MAG: hypothetical protein COS47_00625 [Candidatus Nealsonbacteria bacterium CG03_land_8_20_14_0_80_36_12]
MDLNTGKISKRIRDDVDKLIDWMKSNNVSGSVFSISFEWANNLGVEHDHNFYRRVSTLLKIANEKGLVEFEWEKESDKVISRKFYRLSLSKPVKEQHESDTEQENGVARGYKLNSNMVSDLTRFGFEENRLNFRDKTQYLELE